MRRMSFKKLRNVDFFRKVPSDFTVGTLSGGTISIAACTLLVLLTIGEIREYVKTKSVTSVYVDTSQDAALQINFDVSFPEISCEHLHVEAMDVIGHKRSNVTAHIQKLAKKHGNVLGKGNENVFKGHGWFLADHHQGPTVQKEEKDEHVLEGEEEPEIYHNLKAEHPEIVDWFGEMVSTFKELDERDQLLLKSSMALTNAWVADASDRNHARNVYGGKTATFDITSEEQFKELSNKYRIMLVDFHAPWCSHCRNFAPTYEKLAYFFNTALYAMESIYNHETPDVHHAPNADAANLPKGKILIAAVNCVTQSKICNAHGIAGYPSVRVVRDGQEGAKASYAGGPQNYEVYTGPRTLPNLVKYMIGLAHRLIPRRTDLITQMLSDMPEDKNPTTENAVIAVDPDQHTAKHSHSGCRIMGHVMASRVPGLIRFAVNKGSSFDPSALNTTHEIHSFSFGNAKIEEYMKPYLLKYNQGSPEEQSAKLTWEYTKLFSTSSKRITYEHYLKVVSTTVKWSTGLLLPLYEFTVSSNHFHHGSHNVEVDPELSHMELPSVAFRYDLSPIQIVVREERQPFIKFLISLSAIVGGVFTVAQMVDGAIHRTSDILHKLNLGKQG